MFPLTEDLPEKTVRMKANLGFLLHPSVTSSYTDPAGTVVGFLWGSVSERRFRRFIVGNTQEPTYCLSQEKL